MKGLEILEWFFSKASSDARISIGHVGLYCTLFQLWQDQGLEEDVQVYARELMEKAKISSTATYCKLISDLHELGYVVYKPSFYKRVRSRIIMTNTR